MQVQDDKPYDDINITPMLDLAYVLLVIFILMCTASVQGMKVKLPGTAGSQAKSLALPKTKAVTVNQEGKVFLDTEPVTLEQLEQRLVQFKSQNHDGNVVLKGDGLSEYQNVMDVFDVFGRADITEIGLATKPANSK